MSKYKVKSLTASWNSTNFKVRSMPAGKPVTSDPVDVTTLDDVESRFIPGALTQNGEFTMVAQGLVEPPTLNVAADMTLTIVFNDGSADTSKTVSIPGCILKGIEPPAADATGERAANWSLTFQPGGSDPAAQTGSST